MILTTDLVDSYLERIETAANAKEKQRITNDLLLFYYGLSDEHTVMVKAKMQPFLDDIGRELAKIDPLVQRAHQLLGIRL